jgi:hypothetical protein
MAAKIEDCALIGDTSTAICCFADCIDHIVE